MIFWSSDRATRVNPQYFNEFVTISTALRLHIMVYVDFVSFDRAALNILSSFAMSSAEHSHLWQMLLDLRHLVQDLAHLLHGLNLIRT